MKNFTTPGLVETRQILVRMKVNKSARHKGRAALEAIRANLEKKTENEQRV